jgi:ketosteroid isomerase-like protein
MSKDDVEFVRRSFMTFQSGDIEGAFGFAAPDVELVSRFGAVESGTYKGIDGLRRYVADIDQAWERYDRELEELIDAGDAVVAILKIEAVSRTTGIQLRQRVGFVYWIRDGRIARMVSFPTVDDALDAVGLSA